MPKFNSAQTLEIISRALKEHDAYIEIGFDKAAPKKWCVDIQLPGQEHIFVQSNESLSHTLEEAFREAGWDEKYGPQVEFLRRTNGS